MKDNISFEEKIVLVGFWLFGALFSFPEPLFLLVTWSAKPVALVAAKTRCQ